jgi:alpha-tubulin suppressor-like RCC1 family protein
VGQRIAVADVPGLLMQVIALRADGTVWTWGSNDSGRIGNDELGGVVLAPQQVPQLNL